MPEDNSVSEAKKKKDSANAGNPNAVEANTRGTPATLTRLEYDDMDSDGRFACPDCGSRQTHAHPGCHCPNTIFTRHINLYHHTCKP